MASLAPATRQDPAPATSGRARDQEWKRARGAIACAECRRLKLKCDKTVPCTSCKRRGCAPICPNGSLVTGQGTRFVLASTDRLHVKIAEMSDRIRTLEEALAIAHFSASGTNDPHPLLHRDLMKIKSIIELHGAVGDEANAEDQPRDNVDGEREGERLDIFGTLAVRDDGASMFYGRSAGQESLLLSEDDPDTKDSLVQSPLELTDTTSALSAALPDPTTADPTGLPPAIRALSTAVPLTSTSLITLSDLSVHLPPWHRATELCALYLSQAPWFFGAVKPRQLYEEVVPLFYSQASMPPSTSTLPKATAHDLSLLFVVFCFGALMDPELPNAPNNVEADRYYVLTRAALALDPVMDRAPSVCTVQTLAMVAIYQGLVAGEGSIEATWAWMGVCTKLAQSIGLHRDCARWKLTPSEVEKRRALFWELFITDCWQSLATGRLATFSLPFVDCELPQDTEPTMAADGTPQSSFPHWKARFGKECVSEVVQGILTARPPKYSIIIELDRKIREMDLPKYATEPPPDGGDLNVTMQCYMPINYRHLTLVYVHRAFFAQGLCDQPLDPLRSSYALSVTAGYRSACELLGSLRKQFSYAPARIARFWVLWTHAFSSAVMLALIPVRAPRSKMAHTALLELRQACELFSSAAEHGGRAVKMLPIVKRHLDKAAQSFQTAHNRMSKTPADIFPGPARDEFSIFQGVTHTVATKAKAPRLQASTSGGSSTSSGSRPPAPSQAQAQEMVTYEQTQVSMHGVVASGVAGADHGPPGTATGMPTTVDYQQQQQAWGNVHAGLVDQLMTFEGTLDAQLNSAEWQQYGYGEGVYEGYGEGGEGYAQPYGYAPPAQQDYRQQAYGAGMAPMSQPPPPSHSQPTAAPVHMQPHHAHTSHPPQPPSSYPSSQSTSSYPSSQNASSYPPQSSASYTSSQPSSYTSSQPASYAPVQPASYTSQPASYTSAPPVSYASTQPASSYAPQPAVPPPHQEHYAQPAQPAPAQAFVDYPPPDMPPPTYTDTYSPGTNTTPGSSGAGDSDSPGASANPEPERLWDAQKVWAVPHTEVVPVAAREANPRARDRVLRQSGDLSLTEAWSAFMSQMDVMPGARRAA